MRTAAGRWNRERVIRLDELSKVLPLTLEELQELFARYRQETGNSDVDLFVAQLYNDNRLGADTFRSVAVVGELEIRDVLELRQQQDRKQAEAAAGAEDVRFDVLGRLGRGAMGEVFVARERDLLRKVAIKRLIPEKVHNDELLSRFFREVQITAGLEHPNIVPVYGLQVTDAGVPSCAMKLIHGRTLRQYIKEARLLMGRGEELDDDHSLTRRLEHFLKICDAISYAHSRGIIHRDLKPENIMIGPYNEVYVMDWGVARPVSMPDVDTTFGEEMASAAGIFDTELGAAIGTPHYMSPEQAGGAADLDGSSDQYALGLVLFELVSLVRAVPGDDKLQAMVAALAGRTVPLRHAIPTESIPRELRAIIERATEHHPGYRYESVSALADDLRRYLRGDAVLAHPDTRWQALARAVSRNKDRALILLLIAVVLGLLTGLWGVVSQQRLARLAQEREVAVSAVLTSVATRAGLIDREFLRFEGLLRALGAAAVQALTLEGAAPQGPGGAAALVLQAGVEPSFYLQAAFDDPELAPPDLEWSEHYKKRLSVDWPVFVLAPGVEPADVSPVLTRLSTLRYQFPRIMLASARHEVQVVGHDERRALIAGEGLPLVWAYVGVEEGVHTAFPGKSGYPADYDPRQRPWYTLARNTVGPQWGNPYLDAQGQGLLLPCTMALYDDFGRFRGVAGIEQTFDVIIENLLTFEERDGATESFLIDPTGKVVVRSDYDAQALREQAAHAGGGLELPQFEVPEVLRQIRLKQSGYLERPVGDSAELIVYHRMSSHGWYYAVRFERDEVLGL